MGNANEIQNSILNAIDTIAMRRIEQLQLDKTITGIIDSAGIVTADERKRYKIKYEGGYFWATAQNKNDAYLPNMAVYVQVPKGDFSKDKFILGRVSTTASNAQKSVVSAIANNYGIVGKNIINNLKSDSFGVYSYHSTVEETTINSEENPPVFHRYNLLYQYGNENNQISISDGDLDLYKEDSTAIMLRADFMTKLSSEQKRQSSGEYGLIFSLVFKNLAADTDEDTYRGIFDSFSVRIKVEQQEDNELKTITLKDKDNEILDLLQNTEGKEDEILGEGRRLDIILNDILILQKVFEQNNSLEYTELMKTYLDSYVHMLEDLIRNTSLTQAYNWYKEWMEQKPEIPREKIVSYYINSNNMIGNPFAYTSWNTQYEVFSIDLENFVRIDSIYLYQKGFIQDSKKEKEYLEGNPDILVKNLQFYAMKPLTDYNGTYQLKVEAPNTGMIFESESVDPIVAEAVLIREYFEDLTRNSNSTIYWFKQDKDIISPEQEEYHIYAGPGWKEISNNHSEVLTINVKDNPAYKNYYRCVAAYEGEETPIILRYDFIIINNAGQEFILESNLGNDFSFDAGAPLLTIYKRENNELKELIDDQHYQLTWTIIDGNGQSIVLQKDTANVEEQYISTTPTNRLIRNIKYYHGDNEITIDEVFRASRIKYPMINTATSASVTFEVGIGYRSNIDFSDFPTIGKAILTLNNHKITNLNAYRLVIENGTQVFQYDEYGNAPNSDKVKDPQEILPLTAKIFAPNNLEVASQNFRVKWFFPTGISMISQGENSILENDPATGYVNLYKGQKVDFSIDKLFNYAAFDNQIICQVTFSDLSNSGEDKIFTQSTNFSFVKVGDNGTNGTDMVAKIEPRQNNSIYIDQPPTIITFLKKEKEENQEEKITQVGFFNSLYDNFGKNILPLTGEDGLLDVKLFQKTEEVNLSKANIRWNIAGNTSTASNRQGKYFNIDNNNLIWDSSFVDGKKYRQQILKAEIDYEEKSYYAFYSMPIIEYKEKPSSLIKNRIGINNKTYLKDVLYNNDGRNPLYSHDQGLELINLPENYYIKWEACGGYNEDESIPCFSLLLDKNAQESKKSFVSMDKNFATTIFSKVNENKEENEKISFEDWQEEHRIDTFNKRIYILPNDDYAGNITNNYIKATVYTCKIIQNEDIETFEIENKEIATVYAPINMTLNTFGLASINAWDGNSITLDDERGAILAPQIGAGYKDKKTNLFTGAVMGQADDYSSGKEHLYTGLLGYKDGKRSFFLDAETGDAIFGYPSLESNSNKIEIYNKETEKWEEIDNYNEGEIQLRPGKESKIGGWRLGRRSLYYIQGENGPTSIGDPYTKDYIPKKNGSVSSGNAYNKHHERDIQEDYSGILLHSGSAPYISIKGRKLYPEIQYDINGEPLPNQHPDTDLLSQSAESYLLNGDSLELQLDPQTPTLFTIFRHNGQPRYKDSEKNEPLYSKDSRTFLAGINSRGQLVANGLQTVTKPTEAATGDTITTFGIDTLPAFGEILENASYIGLKLDAGDNRIAKIFVKNDDRNDTTLYMSGSSNKENEYKRPISIHGASVNLYAEDKDSSNNKKNSTDSYIKISKTNLSGKVGEVGFDFIRSSDNLTNIKNSINVKDPLEVKTNDAAFELDTGGQTIKAKGAISITSEGTNSAYTVNSAGAININTTEDKDIILNRNTSNDDNKKNNKISIESDNILIKVNDNNLFKIDSKSITGKSQIITDVPLLDVQNSNGRISILGKSGITGRTDIGESASQVVIKAQDSTSNNYSVIRLGANINNYVGLKNDKGQNIAGYPFTMIFGASPSGGAHCGSIYVRTSNTGNNNYNSNRVELDSLGLQVAQGINIQGDLLDDTHTSKGNALWVNGNTHIEKSLGVEQGINALKYRSTKGTTGFTFDSEQISGSYGDQTYFADGSNLKDLIEDCLKHAAEAKQAAENVQTNLTNFIENRFNGHTHNFSVSGTTKYTAHISAKEVDDHARMNGSGLLVTYTAREGNVVPESSQTVSFNNEMSINPFYEDGQGLKTMLINIDGSDFDKEGTTSYSASGVSEGPNK